MTDVQPAALLASGSQQGEPGDQTVKLRTPHLMDEPLRQQPAAAAFSATLELTRPDPGGNHGRGALGLSSRVATGEHHRAGIPVMTSPTTVSLLHLYGYLVQVEHPKPGRTLDAKGRRDVAGLSADTVRSPGPAAQRLGLSARCIFMPSC